jgi:structural maintenance of chromosome 2
MYIHEIIVEGFKSYAQRTVIAGFDPHFNAITGLNGSGKSNILDSICFVLGISNLSQVRVGNLQELVYKQGQAGVTKASVSIVFNNEDPSKSPIGYEQHRQITVTRQIVIGGRNKCARARRCRRRAPPRAAAAAAAARRRRAVAPRRHCPRARPLRF